MRPSPCAICTIVRVLGPQFLEVALRALDDEDRLREIRRVNDRELRVEGRGQE